MKKYFLTVFFLAILNVYNVFAYEANLTPLKDDVIGLSFEKIPIKYPTIKTAFEKKDDHGKVELYLIFNHNFLNVPQVRRVNRSIRSDKYDLNLWL